MSINDALDKNVLSNKRLILFLFLVLFALGMLIGALVWAQVVSPMEVIKAVAIPDVVFIGPRF